MTDEPPTAAPIVPPVSQISATSRSRRLTRPRWRAAGLVTALLLGSSCGSSLQKNPDGATTSCADIEQAYGDAVFKAQECAVGAAGQCAVQVRAGFFCDCMTWVNGDAQTLTGLANEYRAIGCRSVCNGICVQPQTMTCQADPTSSTGGRCKAPQLLTLTGTDDGGSFAVATGDEIDIYLQDVGPNGYAQDVAFSSNAATVVDVTIPAGPTNPAGPMHLYRLKALSPGQVVVQIAQVSAVSDAAQPGFMITLNIS